MNFGYSASVSDWRLPSGWSALNCQFMVIFIVECFSKSYFCSFLCSVLWIFGSAFEACRVESDAFALDSFGLVSPVASRELRSTTPTASVANRDPQLPPQTSTCFRKYPPYDDHIWLDGILPTTITWSLVAYPLRFYFTHFFIYTS